MSNRVTVLVVEHVKHRRVLSKPKPAPKKADALLVSEVLDRLSHLTNRILTIQGVSRTKPDAFAVDKSEAVNVARNLERDIRDRGIAPRT
jgi:hypothetical protein